MPQYLNFPLGHIYDYGRDGSDVSIRTSTSVTTPLTAELCDSLQRWNTAAGWISFPNNANYFVILFPQPRTITGVVYGPGGSNNSAYVDYSLNSTNGFDGTWVNIATSINSTAGGTGPRGTRFAVTNLVGVKAMRARSTFSVGSGGIYYFQLWTTDDIGGLTPWHPTNDEMLSNDLLNFDRGDIFVNAAPVTQTFRIKNTDGAQTANDVVVSIEAGTGQGLLGDEVRFSLDDTNYATSITLSSIAPGAISPLIYMQRPLITDSAGITRVANVIAKATSWV